MLTTQVITSNRKIAVFVGTLYILAAVTAIIAVILYAPVLSDSNYVMTGGAEARVATGAFLELILAFSIIGISVGLFPIVNKQYPALAIGYVCFRLLEATIIIAGIMNLLSVVTLSREFAKAAAPNAAAFVVAGKSLVAEHNWTFLFGPNVALGPSTFMLGYFWYRSKLVPRFIAIMGLIGGPAIFASATLVLFGVYPQISAWSGILTIPVFAYEMTLAVWLITKGFNARANAS